MRVKPWEVSDGLWERIEPLLPRKRRRFRYPGRKPFDDRRVLQGILFVLHSGSFADELRAAGHVVHAPDLYDGKTFTELADGVGYAEQVAVASARSSTGGARHCVRGSKSTPRQMPAP